MDFERFSSDLMRMTTTTGGAGSAGGRSFCSRENFHSAGNLAFFTKQRKI